MNNENKFKSEAQKYHESNVSNIMIKNDKSGVIDLKFSTPTYKYCVDLKDMNTKLYFVDMTFMQRLFARWFLSGKITKL
jgi:hypothetical protein